MISDSLSTGKKVYIVPIKKIKTKIKKFTKIILEKKMAKVSNGKLEKWLEINKKYSEIWPNISEKKDPPADHEKFKNEQNKYEKYFEENL